MNIFLQSSERQDMVRAILTVESLNGYTERRCKDEGATAEYVIREVLYYLQLAIEARNISITFQEFSNYLTQLEEQLRETFQVKGTEDEIRQMDEVNPDGGVMDTYQSIKEILSITEKN